jgi:hypothetical protein
VPASKEPLPTPFTDEGKRRKAQTSSPAELAHLSNKLFHCFPSSDDEDHPINESRESHSVFSVSSLIKGK